MRALIKTLPRNILSYIGLITIILFSFDLSGQSLNDGWKKELDDAMKEFMTCEKSGGNGNPCAGFMGKSLDIVYQVNDFYSNEKGRYLYVNEISEMLSANNGWTQLGHAYEQQTLETAQNNANNKIATVAVYLHSSGVGHMVVILPGALQPSGSWGFNVPNSSSFFSAAPGRSYVNKGLSYAFTKSLMKDVVIYSKTY